jgi:tripartite-type tricarboxylate transporter receptor subunit TctC
MAPLSTIRSGIAALTLFAGANPAAAAPLERAITVIVPFASGGPGDTVVRIIGEHMAKTLGQPIVVDNVAGGSGTTGITRGSQAKGDGYVIMLGQMEAHGAAPAQYPDLKFDPAKDFAPIGLVAATPSVIIADSIGIEANYQGGGKENVSCP